MANHMDIVRTLWHGPALSIYEELSLLSFVKCGHDVEVYAYEPVDLPKDVRFCDANEIIPRDQIFYYKSGLAKGSFAAFSNLFRLKLLLQKGGIWADSDLLCLKSLRDLPNSFVGRVSDKWLNGAVLRFPQGDPLCRSLCDQVEKLGSDIFLGQTAARLTYALVGEHGCTVLPVQSFYPISTSETWMLLHPEERAHCEMRAAQSYCVHWWNTVLTIAIGVDKSALPPEGSYLYEHAVEVFDRTQLPAWPFDSMESLIRPHKLQALAKAAAASQNWSAAADLWKGALEAYNTSEAPAEVWVNIARIHRRLGLLEVAESYARQGCIKFPGVVGLLTESAEIAMAMYRWKEAAEFWQRIIDEHWDSAGARVYARLARCQCKQVQWNAAEATVSAGLYRYGDHIDLLRVRAELATAKKDWGTAVEHWQVVLDRYGGNAPQNMIKKADFARRKLRAVSELLPGSWTKLNKESG